MATCRHLVRIMLSSIHTVVISLTLVSTIAFSATLPTPKLLSQSLPILCYDHRYATNHPLFADCITIIYKIIGELPQTKKLRSFSRTPDRYQLPLPHTWHTDRQQCKVTIDMLKLHPQEKVPDEAQATMNDIMMAAAEIVDTCVMKDERLGGITQTGKLKNLQVRVEAGARSV